MFFVSSHKSKFLAFLLGFSSIICQIILMRELITIFLGNEIAYAVILASWLFWISVGSGGTTLFLKKTNSSLAIISLSLTQILIFFFAPLTIVAARAVKVWMGVQTGEIIGIIPMGYACFLLLGPLALLFGAFYVMMNVSKFLGKELGGVKINNCDDFANVLLEKANVAVVPGTGFGANLHVRLSYATSYENIKEGMDRIEKFLAF